MTERRLGGVDALRGLAALSVCWFHFTNGNTQFLPPGWLKQSGAYGWLGVEVFFVISGFILPYSMMRRGYRLESDLWRFLAKRVVRLDPPYLVAVVLSVLLWYVSALMPWFQGEAPHISAAQAFAHLGYLNGLLGLPWLSPVFWSLAIEFQFYISLAVCFPLLAHRRTDVRLFALTGLVICGLIPAAPTIVVHYLTLFAFGVACFLFHEGRVGRLGFAALIAVIAVACGATLGAAIAAVATATALVIGASIGGSPLGSWLGGISYSLYLVHVQVGGRIVNAGTRLPRTVLVEAMVLLLAVAASIVAAVILNRVVELPAQRWSARIAYRPASGNTGRSSTIAATGRRGVIEATHE